MIKPLHNDAIVVDEKVFISAKSAAERYGYTPDYIGQLARSGQIAGRLVARTWYVDLGALKDHRERKILRREAQLPNTKYEAEDTPGLPDLKKSSRPSRWGVRLSVIKYAALSFCAFAIVASSGLFWVYAYSPDMGERAVDKIVMVWEGAIDGVRHLASASLWNNNKPENNKLCINDICLTEDDLIKVLDMINSSQ